MVSLALLVGELWLTYLSVNEEQEEDFFHFTRGRFVCNESEQLLQRHIKFDINELAAAAVRATGATRCIKVHKCPDGLYNKAFSLTMGNGKEVIGKIPNPNAGLSHFTTASEVATMDFVSKACIVFEVQHTDKGIIDAECPPNPGSTGLCVEFQS
jgi:hypothetical protein